MTAATHDIVIEQGATTLIEFRLLDDAGLALNLTGVTARMMFRKSAKDQTILAAFTSSPGSGLTTGGVAGTILLSIDAAVTAAYKFANAVYDLEIATPDIRFPISGFVTRVLQGTVTVSPEVTRDNPIT